MIARKSALIIFIQLLNGLLGYIALKFIALYMSPWEYGVVGFAYSFVALFSIFGDLGFNQAHIKRVSEGKDLGTCIATFAYIKLFLVGLMSSAVIGSIFVWKYIFHRGFESPVHEQAVYVMLAYYVLWALSQIMTSTFIARREIAKYQIPSLIYTLVRVTLTLFIAFYNLGVLLLSYSYVVGEFFRFMFNLALFRGYRIGRPSMSYFWSYAKYAINIALVGVSTVVMTNIDKVFIQLFWSAKEVGEYFAVFNLSRFVILFSSAVSTLLLPTISSYHSNHYLDQIKEIVLKAERYLSMITFPIITIMISLAYPIIHILLSDKYLPAVNILQILPLFVLVEVLSGPYTQQLSGMNMPNYARNRVIIMMLTNVLLDMILIPKDISSLGIKLLGWGIKGAAIATVISYIVGLLYIRIVSWRITGVKGNWKVGIHALAALLMAGVLDYIQRYVCIARWYDLIAISLVGISVYFGILFILREFKREDMYFFLEIVNPKGMLRYIVNEIKR